jgi:hypothetical protein
MNALSINSIGEIIFFLAVVGIIFYLACRYVEPDSCSTSKLVKAAFDLREWRRNLKKGDIVGVSTNPMWNGSRVVSTDGIFSNFDTVRISKEIDGIERFYLVRLTELYPLNHV